MRCMPTDNLKKVERRKRLRCSRPTHSPKPFIALYRRLRASTTPAKRKIVLKSLNRIRIDQRNLRESLKMCTNEYHKWTTQRRVNHLTSSVSSLCLCHPKHSQLPYVKSNLIIFASTLAENLSHLWSISLILYVKLKQTFLFTGFRGQLSNFRTPLRNNACRRSNIGLGLPVCPM